MINQVRSRVLFPIDLINMISFLATNGVAQKYKNMNCKKGRQNQSSHLALHLGQMSSQRFKKQKKHDTVKGNSHEGA